MQVFFIAVGITASLCIFGVIASLVSILCTPLILLVVVYGFVKCELESRKETPETTTEEPTEKQ